MKKIILLFVASIILTAVFSYSLEFYLKEDFVTLTLKTMLIPCFTWSILIILAYKKLGAAQRLSYLTIAAWVCVIGSAVLVPGGVYNFLADDPLIIVSIVNVLLCVILMSFVFYHLLRKYSFSLRWWWYFNVLICINMSLFYLSTKV